MGETELGRLYCYVDAAKSMAVDPDHKLVHTACEPCGDDHCAFEMLPPRMMKSRISSDKTYDGRMWTPSWPTPEKTMINEGIVVETGSGHIFTDRAVLHLKRYRPEDPMVRRIPPHHPAIAA